MKKCALTTYESERAPAPPLLRAHGSAPARSHPKEAALTGSVCFLGDLTISSKKFRQSKEEESACAISVSRLQLRVNPKSMAMRRGVRATRPVAPTSGTTGCLLSVFVYRLDYDLTKCQTKALRVPFLAPKYSLVDFVAFSGDSQNTHCCCVGNFSSFLRRLPAEAPFLVIPPF